jgi:hypothetical protein
VDAFVHEICGLFEKGTGKDNDTSGTISNLVILRFGKLYQKFCNVVRDLHLRQDSGAIIGHGNVTVWRNQNLVQPSWSLTIIMSLSLKYKKSNHTSEVLTMLATVLAANMCDLTASLPCCLVFLP